MVGMETRSIFERCNITDDATLREGAERLAGFYEKSVPAERKVIAMGASREQSAPRTRDKSGGGV